MAEATGPSASTPAFLAGDGEMTRRTRQHDWSATPLGPTEGWPPHLRAAVDLMLHSPAPTSLLWGPERIQLYNDAYIPIADGRHPACLGRPAAEIWGDAFQGFLRPIFDRVSSGEAITIEDQRVLVPHPGGHRTVERCFTASFSPIHDEAGRVAGIFHPVVETTDRVLTERRLRQAELRLGDVLDRMDEAFGLMDRDFRILTVNEAALRLEKRPLEAIAGRTHWELYPGSEDSGVGRLLKRALADQQPASLEHHCTSADGTARCLELRAYPVPEGLAVFWRDISERRQAEAMLRASDANHRFLLDLDDEVRGLGSPLAVVSATSKALGQRLGAARVVYAEIDEEQDRATTYGGWTDGTAPQLAADLRLSDFGATMIALLKAGRTVRVDDAGRDPRMADGIASLDAIGARAFVSVPLVKDGRFVLNLNVHRSDPHPWTDAEVRLIETVAERTWGAVERARAQAALRESEARLGFLDRLGAETANLADADAVLSMTTRLLGEHLGIAICAYADMDEDEDGFTIRGDWAAPGSRSIVGHYRLEDFGKLAVRNLSAGLPLVVNDNLSELAPEEAATFQSIGIAATICMPLVKDGRLTALMAIHDRVPRVWTANDLSLLREVTARSWAHVERVGAVAELRESEAQFRAFAQAVPNHVWASRPDGALYWFNDQVYAYSGEPQGSLDGSGWARIVHPDDVPAAAALWSRALASGEVYETEFRIRRADGVFRWFLVRAEPVRGAGGAILDWVGTNTDIEGRRGAEAALRDLNETLEQQVAERAAELATAQEALRQSQKLESMGQLTGGVAHDFNNLLTPIVASLDMLLRREIGSERERRLIDGALQSAERAKVLVQRLLAFARRQPLQPGPVDIGRLVGGMAELIASTSGPRVEVRVELPDDLPPALADANQIEMALLNLAVNARDAMPDGGVLTISAARESVRDPRRTARLRPGHYLRLSVSDTGTGMDEETLARAVEPFFSTKGVGRGTGLGLSMVHGLASQLGGELTIGSSPGRGTTVDLWLPISAVPASGEDQVLAAPEAPRARGTALLVDDEDLVRMSTADMLMDLGYEVVEARSTEEALGLVAAGLAPDLLVSDHLMPGLSGVDLARDLRARRPELPVLIVSGYAEVEGLAPEFPRLAKPFRAAELARSLAALRPAPAG